MVMRHELAILPWNTCTAKCSHCGPSSKPSDKTEIPHPKVLDLIKEAGDTYKKPWYLSLSGGEIFLHYDRLLEYCKSAYSMGGYTAVITNCFWASSNEKAEKLLEPLVDNGLLLLGISFDRFHEQYINPQFVRNAVSIAKKLNISVHIRSVATRSNRLWDILEQFADNCFWYVDFMEIPCIPAGRAITLVPENELIYMEEYPRQKCPGASLTINPKGDGMICCNSASEIDGMNVGNIKDYSLSQIEENFKYSPFVNYLRTNGPAQALELISQEDRGDLEEKSYVSVCHLCHDIFNDENRRNKIKNLINEELWNKLSVVMPGLEESLNDYLSGIGGAVDVK